MHASNATPRRFNAATAVYPIPPEVGELLDAAGADREGFQDVIRAAQPFVPALQRSECLVLAMSYVEAAESTAAAIERAKIDAD